MVRGGWCVVTSVHVTDHVPRTTHYAPGLTQPQPALLTDIRSRAAYSEGAGIYRIVPTAVAVPQGVEELQELVRWAAATGRPLEIGRASCRERVERWGGAGARRRE